MKCNALLCALLACLAVAGQARALESRVRDGVLYLDGKPFIPIMIWLQPDASFPRMAELGVNTICGLYLKDTDGGQRIIEAVDAASAAGLRYVLGYDGKPERREALAAASGRPNVIAWIHGDEPDLPHAGAAPDSDPGARDWQPRSTAEQVAAERRAMREVNPDLPAFMTLTAHFMASKTNRFPAERKAAIYPPLIASCDAAGFDTYPIYGTNMPGNLRDVLQGTRELRALAGPQRLLYAWIETNKGSKWITYEKQLDVLPVHTRSEVWMALIGGARAIGYFTHAWRPEPYTPFACNAAMQAELKRLNAQITRLTPALCAPAAAGASMRLADGLAGQMLATRHDGALWIFAQNLDLGPASEELKQGQNIAPRAGVAEFNVEGLAAGATVEVVDEQRSLVAADGGFSDAFEPLGVHIYRIALPAP